MTRKLYKLALWYIRKLHATDRNYRQEVEKMEWLTYKNCSKAHLIYGLGAEWESVGRYEVIDNAIQRLWEYEALGTVEELKEAKKLLEKLEELKFENEQPKTDWIPCEVEMPKEHDSMFAKLKGTDKWSSGMFEKISDEVNVTIELQDGSRITRTSNTIDGKWEVETNPWLKQKVIAWQPLPQPYKKEGAENDR